MITKVMHSDEALFQPRIVLPVGKESRNEAMQYYVRFLGLSRSGSDGKKAVFEEDIASFVGWPKQGTHYRN